MAIYGPFYASAGTGTNTPGIALVPVPATAGTAVGVPWVLPNSASAGTAASSNVKLVGTVGRDYTITVDYHRTTDKNYYYWAPNLKEVSYYGGSGNLMRVWKVQISNWTTYSGTGPSIGDRIVFDTTGAEAKFLGSNTAHTEARFMVDYTAGPAPIVGETGSVGGAGLRSFDIDVIDYFDGEKLTILCRGPGGDQAGSSTTWSGNTQVVGEWPDALGGIGETFHDAGRYLIVKGDPAQLTPSIRGKFSETRYWIGYAESVSSPGSYFSQSITFFMFNKLEITDLQFRHIAKVLEIWGGANATDIPNSDVADILIDRCIFDGLDAKIGSSPTVWLTTLFSVQKDAIVTRFINCLFYRGTGTIATSGLNVANKATTLLYNCTFDGFYWGVYHSNGTIHAKNTIASNCSDACFKDFGGVSWGDSTNNISTDTTAPGVQPTHSVSPRYQGTLDLHLHREDIYARGAGVDLTNDSRHQFYVDVDLQNRGVFGAWDIGFDESFAIPIYRHPDYTNYSALAGQDAGLITLVDIELQGATLRYATVDCVVPDGENERVYFGYVDNIGDVTESLRVSIGALNAAVSNCSISLIPNSELRTLTPSTPIHGGLVTVRKWAPGIDIVNTFTVLRGVIRDFSTEEDGTHSISVENWEKDVDADIQEVEINSELWENAKEDSYDFPYSVIYGQVYRATIPEIISGIEASVAGGYGTTPQRLMLAGHSVGTIGGIKYVSEDTFRGTAGVLGITETFDSQTNVYTYIETENPDYWGKSCVVNIAGKRDNAFGRATEISFGAITHPAEMAIDAVCDYAGYSYPEEIDLHAFSFLKQKRKGYAFGAHLTSQASVRTFVDAVLSQCLAFGYTRGGLFRVYPFDISGAPKENLLQHGNLLSLSWEEGDPELICHEIKLKYSPRYDRDYQAFWANPDSSRIRRGGWKGKVIATHTDRHGSRWLRSECEDAKRLYGTKPTQVLSYDFISDDTTANLVLNQLVELFTKMRILVSVGATYDAARVKIGDVFTVTHTTPNWHRKKFIALAVSYGYSTISIKGLEV